MSNTRIYVITRNQPDGTPGDDIALVRATHPRQAIAFVVDDQFAARVASQDDLIALHGKVSLSDATAPAPQPQLPLDQPAQG